MYLRNLNKLKPAIQATPPKTTTTNRMEVVQNEAISFSNGPSDDNPYFPMVNDIAPNAPMGATRITMSTMRNTTLLSDSSISTKGFA